MNAIFDKTKYGPWALITGASSGIGMEFSRQLESNGLNVVLAARRISVLEKLGDELSQKYKVKYRAVECDFSKMEGIESLKENTDDLDIGFLISNAGARTSGSFLSITLQDHLAMINLNAVSHVLLTHHYGNKMKLKKKGGIIMVSAMGIAGGAPYFSIIASSKSLVTSLGKALHVELKNHSIDVTVLETSPTNTPVLGKLGLTENSTPLKPLSPKRAVAETLEAFQRKKISIIPGSKFRILNSLVPESTSRKMTAKMLIQNNNLQV
jgi:uncharacterized protein